MHGLWNVKFVIPFGHLCAGISLHKKYSSLQVYKQRNNSSSSSNNSSSNNNFAVFKTPAL